MAKLKAEHSKRNLRPMRPAISPEARENQMISLAVDLVEQRLIDGTASSQETTHYLKLATKETRLKNELLEMQAQLAAAKKEQLQSQKRMEELYADAIKAMKNYSGQGEPDEEY